MLLGAQLLVARQLQGLLERGAIVPRVVRRPRGRLVRKGVRGDQVAPPQLGRVEVQLRRQQVDRPLDQGRRLRSPGSAVGAGGCGVGDHAPHAGTGPLEPVRSRQRRARHRERRDAGVRGMGPEVADNVGVQRHEAPAGIQRQAGPVHRGTRRQGGDQTVGGRLGPAHRAPEPDRGQAHQHLVGIQVFLRAETASRVVADDPHPAVAEPERVGGMVAHMVRGLG